MNPRRTVFVAMVAVALGAILYFGGAQTVSPPSYEYLLENLAPEDLREIQIRFGSEDFVFENSAPERTGPSTGAVTEVDPDLLSHWRLRGVSGGNLDTQRLKALIDALLRLDLSNKLEAGADEAEFGLDNPELYIRVTHTRGASALSFGKMNEYLQRRYLSLGAGKMVYLVDDDLYSMAKWPRDDFRSHHLFAFQDSELSQIELRREGEYIVLKQQPGSGWELKEPLVYPANAEAVEFFTRSLRELYITAFHEMNPENEAAYGLREPAFEVKLTFASSRDPVSAAFSRPAIDDNQRKFVFASMPGDPVIFEAAIRSAAFEGFTVDSFRKRTFFEFASDEVQEVHLLYSGKRPIAVERQPEGDFLVNGKPGDRVFIADLLKRLSSLEAAGFEPASNEIGQIRLEVRVVLGVFGTQAAREELVLKIGAAVKSEKDQGVAFYRVQRVAAQPETFLISADSFKHIALSEETLVAVPVEEQAPL